MIPITEREERYQALRRMMRERGYAALLLAGNAEATQRGYVRYVANWRLWGGKGFVVLPIEGAPVLILGAGSQSHWSKTIGWIDDVRAASNLLAEVVQVITDLGLSRERVGVVGLNEVMLHGDVMALTQGLPEADLVDATTPVDEIMAIKSAAEIAAATETYNAIAHALDVFRSELAPGRNERDVMAQAVRALHERNCLDGIAHLTNGMQPFFRPPLDRRIEPDDIFKVSLEFAGSDGYWIELSGIFSFTEPPPRALRYFDTAKKALYNAAAMVRPGNTGADVTRTVEETFRADGWNVTGRGIWDGHAIGLNVIRPPYGVAESTDAYQENMIINLHPGLMVDADGWGYFMQDNFLVTPDGGRPLGQYVHEWHVLA